VSEPVAGVNSAVIAWFVVLSFLLVAIATLATFLFHRDDLVGLLEGYTIAWVAIFVLKEFLIGLAVKLPGV
jgi:positive regulator of sigma E activity